MAYPGIVLGFWGLAIGACWCAAMLIDGGWRRLRQADPAFSSRIVALAIVVAGAFAMSGYVARGIAPYAADPRMTWEALASRLPELENYPSTIARLGPNQLAWAIGISVASGILLVVGSVRHRNHVALSLLLAPMLALLFYATWPVERGAWTANQFIGMYYPLALCAACMLVWTSGP